VLSGHALNAEDEQRLPNALVIVLVVMLLELTPGVNCDRADVIGLMQEEKLLLLFKLAK